MDLREEIAKIAYELYEKSGRIAGKDIENWLEAEKKVMARVGKGVASTAQQTAQQVRKTADTAAKTVKKAVKKVI